MFGSVVDRKVRDARDAAHLEVLQQQLLVLQWVLHRQWRHGNQESLHTS